MGFPKKFVWGAAAASYQIEGGADADGRSPSIWDMMCEQPGRVLNGDTGAVACDHYHLYEQDVKMMKELELVAYRLSVSWSRVVPEANGKMNPAGLDFYDRLVDRLLENRIDPWVTLFHWDLPYWAFLRGGWLNRDVAEWMADYTRIIVDRLSDRVRNWMTLNEPQCFIGYGYKVGIQAPGLQLGDREMLQCWHHALLAHGKTAQVIRSHARITPHIGAAVCGPVCMPVTEAPEEVEAARKAMFAVKDFWNFSWFCDPMVFGRYPADGLKWWEKSMPAFKSHDLKTIAQPLDFFGVNIYNGSLVKAGADGEPEFQTLEVGYPKTSFKWAVTPTALYWGPRFLYERYRLPVVITENGMANADVVSLDGKVHDPQRIDFLQRYLRELRRAIGDGVDVRGYFEWSVMDNFEWAQGYAERFGMVHVDFNTLKRTPKDSAWWYREVIRSNGECL